MPVNLFMYHFNEMRRIIIKLIIFLIAIIISDRALGIIFDSLYKNAKGGYTERNYSIMHNTTEDILVFGSSRATHHYIPSIISDITGLSCRNCGIDGMGIILEYGQLQIISEHYIPQIIIIDINASFCIEQNDNTKYLSYLRPESHDKVIAGILEDIDSTEKYKCISKMYVYNSQILKLLADNYAPTTLSNDNGYIPINGIIQDFPTQFNNHQEFNVDSTKLKYIEKTITKFKNQARLIFVISPVIAATQTPSIYTPLYSLCKKYNITLLDYSASYFSLKREYWKDSAHLNDKGAKAFTKQFAFDLKKELAK